MARDADEVEWLEAEPPPNPAAPHPSRRAWYLLLGAVAVAVVLVLMLTSHGSKRAARPATSTAKSSTSLSSVSPKPSAPLTPAVSVTNLRRPLLNVPPSWELFARGANAIYRIQLAAGRIVRTSAPLASSGYVSLVVGPHEVIVRPWDVVAGYVIRDGQPARDLVGLLARGGPALPGPTPSQVWVQAGDEQHPQLVLVDMEGRPTGVSVPGQNHGVVSDGAGYVLVSLVGGSYDARPDGLHRITTGTVLATGPTGWLTEECDDRHRCTLDVIDRHSGAHRTLGPTTDNDYSSGVISPDGSLAALVAQAGPDSRVVVVDLLDLRSGADHPTPIARSGDQDLADAIVWSPDSRWLFAVNEDGNIVAVNRAGHLRPLNTRLPAIAQLAMR